MRINLPISFLAVFGLLVATHGSNLRSQRFLQQNDEADKADIDPGSTVVGGTAAAGGEFPFFARFGDGSCGGTLVRSIQLTAVLYSIFNCANVVSFFASIHSIQISSDRVLTAAHCVRGGAPSFVLIGGTTSGGGTRKSVCCSVTHPGWSSSRPFVNDLAVLKLCSNIGGVSAVTINTNTAIPAASSSVQVVGFGQTTAGGGTGQGSSTLQKLTYTTVSDASCKSSWGSAVSEGLHVCVQNTASTGVSLSLCARCVYLSQIYSLT